ncbi:uncharacterized protein LOC124420644 [Lucilia cuprina]|uniref:uncharacterized protein LOC124420644 n=1 Tax=Lucilia cuprina TaxID=7375 RepID=UPI001F06A5D1|nr:uncharacterized protein LOC124420644 [Lucilia cuprina]
MFLNIFIKVIITLLLLIITTIFNNCKLLNASELHHVYCNKAFILVKLPLTSNNSDNFLNTIHWENLYSMAVKECQPLYNEREVILKVFFNDLGKCGFLRSINKLKYKKNNFA